MNKIIIALLLSFVTFLCHGAEKEFWEYAFTVDNNTDNKYKIEMVRNPIRDCFDKKFTPGIINEHVKNTQVKFKVEKNQGCNFDFALITDHPKDQKDIQKGVVQFMDSSHRWLAEGVGTIPWNAPFDVVNGKITIGQETR